ncbi:MORN repeat-containing protein [Caballeronia insecticola]|uniref:MORN repeat-containing protein n=1 Tax=Caballeronia insecticola TaxID=758793 RepID=R4WP54_9BURK|nr:MORN repeat-containing protein [Caballeronia insecticola]
MTIAISCLAWSWASARAENLVRADGGRYQGQVVDGKAEGQGTETRPDGTILKGRFVKDAFVEGTMRTGGWVVPFSNCHSPPLADTAAPAKK